MVPNVPRDYSIPHASVELIPACIQKVLTECMYTCLNKQIICNCSCVANLFLYTCRYVYQHMFYKSLQVHQTSYKGNPQSDRSQGRAYMILIRSLVSLIVLKKVF